MHPRSFLPSLARRRASLPSLLALMATALVAACSDSPSGAPRSFIDLTAAFHLSSVNSTNVPYQEAYTLFSGGVAQTDSQTFNSGTLAFNPDDTFLLTMSVRNKILTGTQIVSDQTATVTWQGTWGLVGSALSFSYIDSNTGARVVLDGTAGDGIVTIKSPTTVQTSATQTTVITHNLTFVR